MEPGVSPPGGDGTGTVGQWPTMLHSARERERDNPVCSRWSGVKWQRDGRLHEKVSVPLGSALQSVITEHAFQPFTKDGRGNHRAREMAIESQQILVSRHQEVGLASQHQIDKKPVVSIPAARCVRL